MWLMEDRIKLVSAEFPGSDEVKSRLCHSLGLEKTWTSSVLLLGSEFANRSLLSLDCFLTKDDLFKLQTISLQELRYSHTSYTYRGLNTRYFLE